MMIEVTPSSTVYKGKRGLKEPYALMLSTDKGMYFLSFYIIFVMYI